jgi:hypothetical protein
MAFRGTVVEVSHPDGIGTHVWLENAGRTQEVCLGDWRFLKDHGFVPRTGDEIEVTGRTDGRLLIAESLTLETRKLDIQRSETSSSRSKHQCRSL